MNNSKNPVNNLKTPMNTAVNCAIQYGILLVAFLFSAIIAYYALTDPTSLDNQAFRYFLLEFHLQS